MTESKSCGFQPYRGRSSGMLESRRGIGSSDGFLPESILRRINFGCPLGAHLFSSMITANFSAHGLIPSVAMMCHLWPSASHRQWPSFFFEGDVLRLIRLELRNIRRSARGTITGSKAAVCVALVRSSSPEKLASAGGATAWHAAIRAVCQFGTLQYDQFWFFIGQFRVFFHCFSVPCAMLDSPGVPFSQDHLRLEAYLPWGWRRGTELGLYFTHFSGLSSDY